MAVFFSCLWSSVSLQKWSLTDIGLSQVPRALTGRSWKWRTALVRRSVSLPALWHIQTDRSLRANDSSLLLEMIEAHHRDLYQSTNVCGCVCVCMYRSSDERWRHKGMRAASNFLTWKWGSRFLLSEWREYGECKKKNPSSFPDLWISKYVSPFVDGGCGWQKLHLLITGNYQIKSYVPWLTSRFACRLLFSV